MPASKQRSLRPPIDLHERPVNAGQLLAILGDVGPERVLLQPPPRQATRKDLVQRLEHGEVRCELIDGTLVDKPSGQIEAVLGSWLIHQLWAYFEANNLGVVCCPSLPIQLRSGLIRIPEVAVVSFKRSSAGRSRNQAVVTRIPAHVIEITHVGCSKREIQKRIGDYLAAGVPIIWIVDPRKRTVSVYSDISSSVTLQENETLEGGEILPGFKMSIREWFDKIR